jgi:hypothetical protein
MTVTPEFKEASARAAIRALRALEQTAIMLETYAPEIFPEVNEQGQKHFGRVMMESAAEAIRDAWKAAIVEVEAFPDDPTNLLEDRGRLRQTLLEISGELGAALVQRAPSDDAIIMGHVESASQLAKSALKSGLVT